MAVEAQNNCWTYAEDKLATALPNLAEFLVLTSAVDATAAAAHVFIDEADLPHDAEAFDKAELEDRHAIVIVCSSTRSPYTKVRSLLDLFLAEGRLVFYVERTIPPEEEDTEDTENKQKQAHDRWLKNRVGKLLDELADYWLENSGPWIRRMGVSEGPYHNDPEAWSTEGHFQGCECFIEWGVQSEL